MRFILTKLDPLDVTLRLADLAELPAAWLDGKGQALDAAQTQWLASAFEENFDPRLPLPHIYPTAEGGVQAEWSIDGWEASLEIDMTTKNAYFQALHLSTNQLCEHDLDMGHTAGWQQLNAALLQMGGEAA